MSWIVRETDFDKEKIPHRGNKFMTGNGVMGIRGTMEEYGKNELAAITLAGVFDQVGSEWREPVNAPHGLSTRLYADGIQLSLLTGEPLEHVQELDIRYGLHRRKTVFKAPGGGRVTVASERFASMADTHLIAMKYTVMCESQAELRIETGIDGDVWDINGPHLERMQTGETADLLWSSSVTHEQGIPVAVSEGLAGEDWTQEVLVKDRSVYRRLLLTCTPGEAYSFVKFVSVYTGLDLEGTPGTAAAQTVRSAMSQGYEAVLGSHKRRWEELWETADVEIEGDDEAQLALRYSMYQLLIIAPFGSEKVSIPARGLSGQVYKGAVFWDTEMFMLPFYLHTHPAVARNVLLYRCHTLNGARHKAKEYGFQGAFYAWESQEKGDDACTLFNITDVFTGRPMRTYFRDKQVHISADVAYGIWQYYRFTGDTDIFLSGGAEVILECARFFYSYAYFKPEKNRYEILDVTGPDEYHERVNNNAFTNYMVRETLDIALAMAELLQVRYPAEWNQLLTELDYREGLERIREMRSKLYVPEADTDNRLIPQFDGYFSLEDVPLKELKERVLVPNEYWGGGSGLATTTQILKQADVVLLLHLFRDEFGQDVKQINWKYYEPRTEHGSSLSHCIYALVASEIGMSDWAYPYFMKTATIDLTGQSKQYVGSLYIGGTHPAANGGAWMAAIQGFAGVRLEEGMIAIRPSLPEKWKSVRFSVIASGQTFRVHVTHQSVSIDSSAGNTAPQAFRVGKYDLTCQAGENIICNYLP
jgi:nigerose phosphorylase